MGTANPNDDSFLARRLASLSNGSSAGSSIMPLKKGEKFISLTIGEPNFPTPPHIIEAAIAALRNGDTGYQPVGGVPELRDAIREKFAQTKLIFSDDQILVGVGAKQLVFAALGATINPDDEVVIPAPYWVSYPRIALIFGGKPIEIQCSPESQFKITPEQLDAALTERTKWFIVNSPGNPGGAVYSNAEFSALGRVLERYPSCLILSDEIYENYVYEGNTYTPFLAANPALADRVVTVNGLSKTYGMPGLRVGYAGAPALLAKAMTVILSQDTSCLVSTSQQAAVAAFNGDQSWIGANRVAYQGRRDRMMKHLKGISRIDCVMPQGAFYVFPSVAQLIGLATPDGDVLKGDNDVVRYLTNSARVKTGAGSSYGSPSFLRFSFSTSLEMIDQACAALSVAIEALKPVGGEAKQI
jgi:aspartate aminotransferase